MSEHDEAEDPIWFERDDARQYGAFLRRTMILLALVVIAGASVLAVNVNDRTARAERDDDLAFTAVVSLLPTEDIGRLLAASGREGLLVRPGVTLREFLTSDSATSERYRRWRVRIRAASFGVDDHHFVTVDPDGRTWWHVAVDGPDGAVLISSRLAEEGMAVATGTVVAIVWGTAAILVALGAVWVFLSVRVSSPARVLLAAGEDLRVRGEIRRDVRDRLERIPETPAELKQLGQTLRQIEADSQRGFEQVDALLQAASALGGSLDQETVLAATLEHLEHVLGIDRSAILRYRPRTDTFEAVAVRGHSEQYLEDIALIRGTTSVPSIRAIRDKVPIQVSDTESEVVSDELRQRGRRHGYRSLLAVPLAGDLDMPTVLILHSEQERTYSFDEIELSKSFGSIAGAAIHNAELFSKTDARLRRQTSRLEAIVESVDQGLLVEGANGQVLYANDAMRNLAPSGVRFLEGALTSELLQTVLGSSSDQLALVDGLDEQDAGAWCEVELPSIAGGVARSFRVRKFLVRDARGQNIGRGQTWVDVTRDRDLERMKSGLLAAVSHEFRTPLALIKGYATTLLAKDVTWNAEDQTDFLRMVSAEADRLTDLVQRILDMRRIDAGMVSLQLMPVGLDVVVDSMRDGMAHEADRIRVTELPNVTVQIDAARIVTALRNLVDNACKYSPKHEPVEVSATIRDDQLEISVRDHGPGVPDALRERIFDTFIRGDNDLDAEHRGVGLGLAISRGFVEAHGGKMWVADVDNGAEFRFTLPLASAGVGV